MQPVELFGREDLAGEDDRPERGSAPGPGSVRASSVNADGTEYQTDTPSRAMNDESSAPRYVSRPVRGPRSHRSVRRGTGRRRRDRGATARGSRVCPGGPPRAPRHTSGRSPTRADGTASRPSDSRSNPTYRGCTQGLYRSRRRTTHLELPPVIDRITGTGCSIASGSSPTAIATETCLSIPGSSECAPSWSRSARRSNNLLRSLQPSRRRFGSSGTYAAPPS